MREEKMLHNRRQSNRILVGWPIEVSISAEVTIQGRLKDLSAQSACIQMKSSVYMQCNDKLTFVMKSPSGDISGEARISRITVGEGIVIYFTKLLEDSESRLQQMIRR